MKPLPVFFAALLALPGCTLVSLNEQTRVYSTATVLAGHAMPPAGWSGPVVVAAVSPQGEIAHRVWLHEPGGYELIVPAGRYTVVAYGDSDGDGRVDRDEPAAQFPTPVDASGHGMLPGLDLNLSMEATAAVRKLLPSSPAPHTHSTQVGAIADLDAAAFSAESGRHGYWAPLDAFRETGGNVYFLEPYDPKRTPVLFVHGAQGSAQDFRFLFEQLDRSRYQAWFFQYPSGAPLDSMAHLLFWKLLNLQMRYGFERLHVVAHSMGGLVVRRFVLNHGAQFPQLDQFVSISTPWGGEKSAATGVEHSPAVVPSWRDMQPEGEFLQRLFAQPLPPTVTHTLLFGHRGGYNLMRPTTDGTVTLASQLRPEAQAGARLVMGFDEDHVSILAAPAVMEQLTRVLKSGDAALSANSGRLQVELEYPEASTPFPASAPPFLILFLEGSVDSPIMLPLSHSGATSLGSLAPGNYDLRLLAHGFRCAPARQRITIKTDEVTAAQIRLTPQGVLNGYVGIDGDSLAYPAGSFRPPHPTLVIDRITLRGATISRSLVPQAADREFVWESYIDGRDAAAGAQFSFVNLEAGEYELEIFAKGYKPFAGRYHVIPGTPPLIPAIVLQR